MAGSYTEKASDLSDSDAISRIIDLSSVDAKAKWTISIFRQGQTQPAVSGSASLEEVRKSFFGGDEEGRGFLRTVGRMTLQGVRGTASAQITYSRAGSEVSLVFAHPDGAGGEELTIAVMVRAHRGGLVVPPLSMHAASDEAAIRALSEQVAQLRELVNVQAVNNEKMRVKRENDFEAYRQKMIVEDADRLTRARQDIESWKIEIQGYSHQTRVSLAEREEAVAEREKSLDLQGEREQRRMLRRDIQTAAKGMFEKPDLSPDAKMNFDRVATACKWIIGGAAVFLLLALIGPVIIELAKDVVLSAEMLALAWSVRVLAGIALVSCSVYYVRWLSTWSRQVTTNELRSKQFALDIDRASWLVEMALEYEKEGKTLNAGLIDSFSRGLFEAEHKPSREQPSNSLLHLIRNAESLKVGAAGAELSLTGRQVQRADAQAAKDHEA